MEKDKKKPYETPVLTEHVNLNEITKGELPVTSYFDQ